MSLLGSDLTLLIDRQGDGLAGGSTWPQLGTCIAPKELCKLESGYVHTGACHVSEAISRVGTGVASTAIHPEPTKGAVGSGPTNSCAVPVRPVMRVRSTMCA